METDAKRATQHLERALAMRKIAHEMRASDPKSAVLLIEVAEDYERMAAKITAALGG